MATLSSKVSPSGVATAAQGGLADSAVQPNDNISTLTNDAGYLTVAPAPFTPTTVTGTTPSLDLGSFNFFDNGTLSGDTTVTFASVPTQARWAYSFETNNPDVWDVSAAVLSRDFSVSTEQTEPTDLFFKPDGTKMYVSGNTTDEINEYSLITPWDVSSAFFVRVFGVGAQDANPHGIFFKSDGTKMYFSGYTGQDITEYNLSSAWNISTAVFSGVFSVAAQETGPSSLFFKPDGTKMYVLGLVGQDVNEYSLSTPWSTPTASFVQSFSVAAQDTSPQGLSFKPDGTKMYVIGAAGQDINEYNLSTPWDVSTASFLQLFSVAAQDTSPYGVFFKPDGAKMYVIGQVGDSIYEYDVGAPTAVTLPASVQNPPTLDSEAGSKVTYDFYTLDGGTNVYLINEEVL